MILIIDEGWHGPSGFFLKGDNIFANEKGAVSCSTVIKIDLVIALEPSVVDLALEIATEIGANVFVLLECGLI